MPLYFKFDSELKNLDIYLIGKNQEKLGHTDNPHLTWDPDKIEGKKDIIKKLFGPGNTIINYDNLPIVWLSDKLFPPSIDSMFLMKTLKEKGYLEKDIKSVIDIGTGTGVNGLYLLKNNPYIEKAYLTDYQPEALNNVFVNSKINGLIDKIIFGLGDCFDIKEFYSNDGIYNLKSLPKADLIIANPPYIPETPEMKKERGDKVNPYQGTDLIKKLINGYEKYGKELILQVSSVCEKEASLNGKLIAEMDVPARFTFLTPEHRKFLVEKGYMSIEKPSEFILRATNNGEYPTQTLKIYSFKP